MRNTLTPAKLNAKVDSIFDLLRRKSDEETTTRLESDIREVSSTLHQRCANTEATVSELKNRIRFLEERLNNARF